MILMKKVFTYLNLSILSGSVITRHPSDVVATVGGVAQFRLIPYLYTHHSDNSNFRCEARADPDLLDSMEIKWRINGTYIQSEGTKLQVSGCSCTLKEFN